MSYLFYVDSDDVGLVVENVSGEPLYSKNDKAATLKLYGKYEEPDMASDATSPSFINSRHHKALAYRVLAEILPKERKYYMSLYDKMVIKIRANQNIFTGVRTTRNYYF